MADDAALFFAFTGKLDTARFILERHPELAGFFPLCV
jgi:hypothetical protein